MRGEGVGMRGGRVFSEGIIDLLITWWGQDGV